MFFFCNLISLGHFSPLQIYVQHFSLYLVCVYIYLPSLSGPCPLRDLRTSLDCTSNTAMVSWTPGSGILHYNASADAFNVVDRQSCYTSGSACNISSLRCGETYRVSVNGQGRNCPSPGQDWHRLTTGKAVARAQFISV